MKMQVILDEADIRGIKKIVSDVTNMLYEDKISNEQKRWAQRKIEELESIICGR